MNRRQLLKFFFSASATYPMLAHTAIDSRASIRIGLTPVFLDDRISFLTRWQAYLQSKTGLNVAFIQRNDYEPIINALLNQQIDYAWLCGYPYVENQAELELFAIPNYHNQPTYQAYIIRHHHATQLNDFDQLKGCIFAYSDAKSNSGYLYPQFLLSQKQNPNFFKKTFFTHAHRKTIEAVAAGVADAGSVDGYVWDTLNQTHPQITQQTTIIQRSPSFGFPPFVTHRLNKATHKQILSEALLGMTEDAEGRAILATLNLSYFSAPNDQIYDGIRNMLKNMR
jgi:phosphonate transport system substrate-binding protein